VTSVVESSPSTTSVPAPVDSGSTLEITESVLFSDRAVDVLNAFDLSDRIGKLEICRDTSEVLARLTSEELHLKTATMSDYSFSTLQSLATDCNSLIQ